MRSHSTSWARVFGAAAFLALLSAAPPAGRAQAENGLFAELSGSWVGEGNISLANGTSERIRCRVKYSTSPSGKNLHQDLRCASDSYRFDVLSNVVYQGGAISGTWTETTRKATGQISGRVSGGSITATISGPSVSAEFSLDMRGNQQTVSIRSSGSDVTSVSMTLARA
ncbi:MAG: hypothetical protein JO273_17450 [Methylobacteriaceae bacterium]|nr:hypothetical protein [Methylobacteriaceae bacterium]MBV9633435.1 hypothetical protein [Methylobacteriaceae bacterium]